jgi:hypothetical protein
MHRKLSYANVMATIAVFIALGGSAYAFQLGKNSVGSKQLRKNAVTTAKIKAGAVTGAKIKQGTITGTQISASTLGTVPSAQKAHEAQTATTAQTASALTPSEGWQEVTNLGVCTTNPVFADWEPAGGEFAAPAYYRDQAGIVHLRGAVKCPFPAGGFSVFNLPEGFRPETNQYFPATVGESALAPVVVSSFGYVLNRGSVGVEALSLDAVSFRCGPLGRNGCP